MQWKLTRMVYLSATSEFIMCPDELELPPVPRSQAERNKRLSRSFIDEVRQKDPKILEHRLSETGFRRKCHFIHDPEERGRSLDAIDGTWVYWLNEVCNQKSKGCKFTHMESDRSQKLPLLENDMDRGGNYRAFHYRSLPHLSQACSTKARREKEVAVGSAAV